MSDTQPDPSRKRRRAVDDTESASPFVRRRVAIGVAAIVVAVAAPFALDLVQARGAFAEAEAAMDDVRAALLSSDLDTARVAAREAQTRADAAARRVDGPVWWTLSKVPWLGASAEVGRAAGALATASAHAAVVVTEEGERLFDEDGTLRVEVNNGKVDLQILADAGAVLDRVPLDDLHDAVARLESTRSGFVPAFAARQRDRALDVAGEALRDVETATLATDALPGFLGADGKRTYLLAFQNPSELRATGGFLGFLGTLVVEDGEFRLGASLGLDPLSPDAAAPVIWRGLFDNSSLPAVDAPDEFKDRYDRIAGRSFFASVNTDPEFPMVAPIMMDLWEARLGQRLDGVIAADPVMLREVLRVTGPLIVPESVRHPELPDEIAPDDLIKTILADAYDVLGGSSQIRKDYHRAVAETAFAAIFGGGWKPRPMLTTLGEAAASRHLQLFSADPMEQALWSRINADGRFAPTTTAGDFLAITANNAGANKSDIHVEHHFDIDYEVLSIDEEKGTALRRATITIEVVNNLEPFGHDGYLINSSFPKIFGTERIRDPAMGQNRTWFTVWSREGTGYSAIYEGDRLMPVNKTTMHGLQLYDYDLVTPSMSSSSWTIKFDGVVPLTSTADGLAINLTWRPPTSAVQDATVTVTASAPAPPGWTVTVPALPARAPTDGAQIRLLRQ